MTFLKLAFLAAGSSQLRAGARWFAVPALAACAMASSPLLAGERAVFRSEMPDGRVVYADAPIEGAIRSTLLSVEPHPGDAAQALAAQQALEVQRARLEKDSRTRQLLLEQLNQRISLAERDVDIALSAQQDGKVIGEGDRQGRRFAPSYWQRQRNLAQQVEQASQRLEALRAERQALL